MNRKVINIVVIILIAIGAISGLLILYDYLESPHFISKSKAIEVFWNTINCTGNFEKQGNVAVDLIHIVNDTRKYYVDEENMQDMALTFVVNKNGFKENQYVWMVHGDCNISNLNSTLYGIRSEIYYIDAKTGELQR